MCAGARGGWDLNLTVGVGSGSAGTFFFPEFCAVLTAACRETMPRFSQAMPFFR